MQRPEWNRGNPEHRPRRLTKGGNSYEELCQAVANRTGDLIHKYDIGGLDENSESWYEYKTIDGVRLTMSEEDLKRTGIVAGFHLWDSTRKMHERAERTAKADHLARITNKNGTTFTGMTHWNPATKSYRIAVKMGLIDTVVDISSSDVAEIHVPRPTDFDNAVNKQETYKLEKIKHEYAMFEYDVIAGYSLAKIYMGQGKSYEAWRCCSEVISSNPKAVDNKQFSEIYMELQRILFDHRKTEENPRDADSEKTETPISRLLATLVPIPEKNYRMGKYEVTQAQWDALMNTNPSRFTGADNPAGRGDLEENCTDSPPAFGAGFVDVVVASSRRGPEERETQLMNGD